MREISKGMFLMDIFTGKIIRVIETDVKNDIELFALFPETKGPFHKAIQMPSLEEPTKINISILPEQSLISDHKSIPADDDLIKLFDFIEENLARQDKKRNH